MPVVAINTLTVDLALSIEALQAVDAIYPQLVRLTAAQQRLVLQKLAERLKCNEELNGKRSSER